MVEGRPPEQQAAGSPAASASVAEFLASVIVERATRVIVVWALALGVSLLFAPALLEAVRASYEPEPGMPSFQAAEALGRHFPGLADRTVESFLFETQGNVSVWDQATTMREACADLDKVVDQIRASRPGLVESATYYDAADGRVKLLEVTWASTDGESRQNARVFAQQLLRAGRSADAVYGPRGVRVSATGPNALALAAQRQAHRDIGVHAVMFLPVAALAMHSQLRRWPLLPLPALSAFAALSVAFACALAVTRRSTMDQNVPTLMAFLSISLCIDWSFFLLSRFREEEESPDADGEAEVGVVDEVAHRGRVRVALARTGSNVALSGLLIVACSACMSLMPHAVASNAIGATIATGSSLLSCLTLLPACLAALPGHLGSPGPPRQQGWQELVEETPGGSEAASSYAPSPATSMATTSMATSGAQSPEARRRGRQGKDCSSIAWRCWAKLVTHFPCNIMLLGSVALLCLPLVPKLWAYVPAVDDSLCVSPDDPAVVTQTRIRELFSGQVRAGTQIYLLLEASPHCDAGVRSEGFFNAACDMAKSVLALNASDRPLLTSDLQGAAFAAVPGFVGLRCIPWRTHLHDMKEAGEALAGNLTPSAHLLLTGKTRYATFMDSEEYLYLREVYRQMWAHSVSADERAMLIAVHLSWNDVSWPGFGLVRDLRRLLAAPELPLGNSTAGAEGEAWQCGTLQGWEISDTGVWNDYIVASIGTLPLAILLGCFVSSVLIGLAYQSAIAALKLLLTVVIPLAWVYGAAVWSFQDGPLSTWGWGTLTPGSAPGLHWMVPCSTSMLLLALALDYNVFYFGRALEFRHSGVSDLEAVRQGLTATGPVITCAGAIFALEFSGLLLSEAALNRQGGFVVVVGVLVDTFIVRSCLLPAALSLGARWNWWPARMPKVVQASCFDVDPVPHHSGLVLNREMDCGEVGQGETGF